MSEASERTSRLPADIGALLWLDLRRLRGLFVRLLGRRGPIVLYVLCGAAAVTAAALIWLAAGPPAKAPGPASFSEPGAKTAAASFAYYALLTTGAAVYAVTRQGLAAFQPPDCDHLFTSPISPRAIFAYRLGRRLLGRLLGAAPILIIFHLAWRLERLSAFLALWLLIAGVQALAVSLAALAWLWAQRGEGALAGRRLSKLRSGLVAAAAIAGAWTLQPFIARLAERPSDWTELGAAALDRGLALASVPPLSWAAGAVQGLLQGEVRLAAAGCFLAASVLLAAWAVFWAQGYYEAAGREAQRHAALSESAVQAAQTDITGAAAELLGGRIRMVRAPLIGWGPWALFGAQLVRHIRFQASAFTLMLVFIVGLGSLAGALIRSGAIPPAVLFAFLGLFAVAGGTGYMREELCRPYVFTVPGSAWNRLLAVTAVAMTDQAFTSGLILLIACAVGGVSFADAGPAALWLAAMIVFGAAAQAAATTLLPTWLERAAQGALRVLLILVSLTPAAAAGVWAGQVCGVRGGVLAAAGTVLLMAGLLAVVAVTRFSGLEMQ